MCRSPFAVYGDFLLSRLQIWVMQLPVRHKIAVSGMFLLGGLYVVCRPSDLSLYLSRRRTVGSGIAKLIFFNIIVQGACQTGPYQRDMH